MFSPRGSRIVPPPNAALVAFAALAGGSRERHQQRMHSRVVRELWMKSAEHDLALPDRDGMAVDASENLHVLSEVLDPRRAEEPGAPGVLPELTRLDRRLEAGDLAPEGVALGLRVDKP